MPKQKTISELTPDNLDLKVIKKLELIKDHSYLLLFNTGTIPFEQAKNLGTLLADAGFKALFVAVQSTDGITVIEKEEIPVSEIKVEKKSKKNN